MIFDPSISMEGYHPHNLDDFLEVTDNMRDTRYRDDVESDVYDLIWNKMKGQDPRSVAREIHILRYNKVLDLHTKGELEQITEIKDM